MSVQRGDVLQVARGLYSARERDGQRGYKQGVCSSCRQAVIVHPVTVAVRAKAAACGCRACLPLPPLVCEVCLPAAPTRPAARGEGA